MKIIIVSALKEEITFLAKKKNFIKEKKIFHKKIFNKKIILCKIGIGKTSAGVNCALLLKKYNPNLIINIGTAGSLNKRLKIGSLIIPNKVCYYDVNMTSFKQLIGQVEGFPQKFLINSKFFSKTIYFLKKNNLKYITGLSISGDQFINNKKKLKKLKKNFSNAISVDMESASIGQTCYMFKTPFLIIRSISDFSTKNSHEIYKKNKKYSIKKCSYLIYKLIKFF
ncbi:5'-methylthioadenosine/S-adenosylhomocysteine nucleosidase [Buchnera aphidicola (Periphyllus testudinaceus)]|uniref:5'-methylthioadenosine/S-adenosylhomocysteine nucleosidase n=1 Tax=Buchnera aphidicola TaxID=9 RepID=UPI003464037C